MYDNSISLAAQKCRDTFDECIESPAMTQEVLLRPAQGDFNLWCAATNAIGTGKSSLSYVLREHSDARDSICGLILALADSVRAAFEAISEQNSAEEPGMRTREELLEERPESPSSWTTFSEANEPFTDEDIDDPYLAEQMSYIRLFTGQLSRLAVEIRRSGNKVRFERIDKSLDESRFDDYRKQLTTVILREFPDPQAHEQSATERCTRASDWNRLNGVQKSLIQANIVRRNRLEAMSGFQESRTTLPPVLPTNLVIRTSSPSHFPPTAQKPENNEQSSELDLKLPVEVPKSVIQSQAPTTTATGVGSDLDDRFKKVMNRENRSDITRMTSTAWKASHSYPSCPALDTRGRLMCYYCGDAIAMSEGLSGGKPAIKQKLIERWQSHVAKDVTPYTCIHDDCVGAWALSAQAKGNRTKIPDMFLTADNFLIHMTDNHSVLCWTCGYCPGDSYASPEAGALASEMIFTSAEDWTQHMATSHPKLIMPENRMIIADMNKRRLMQPLSCPLCDFQSESHTANIPDHILVHLHEFALRALPEGMQDADDEASSQMMTSYADLSYTKIPKDNADKLEYGVITLETLLNALINLRPEKSMATTAFQVNLGPAGFEVWQASAHRLHAMSHIKDRIELEQDAHIFEQRLNDELERLESAWGYKEPPILSDSRVSEPFKKLKPVEIPFIGVNFVGKMDMIEDVYQKFISQAESSRGFSVALHGQPPVANRSVASSVAKRLHEEAGHSIFWISSSTKDSVDQALARIADSFGDIISSKLTAPTRRRHLLHYLTWSFDRPWLMVFDELNPITTHDVVFEGLLPRGLRGSVLFTISEPRCAKLLHAYETLLVSPQNIETTPPKEPIIPNHLKLAPSKRALLIGSGISLLRGIENDLNLMVNVLQSRGFDVGNESYVKILLRQNATRKNILDSWEDLIHSTSQGDTVVIYYSGHGVNVQFDSARDNSESWPDIQFIVPQDFDQSMKTWSGIFAGEISLLLQRISAKTNNVTIILECCHASRLGHAVGFDPSDLKVPHFSNPLYANLAKILENLRKDGKLGEDSLDSNQHVVCLAAAGAHETAWEYHENDHNYTGIFTKNLAKVLMYHEGRRSWRDIMLEVTTLVEQDYPTGKQRPRSTGPDNRIPFSLEEADTRMVLATVWDDGYTTVRGGRVNGIQEGDVYKVSPFGTRSRSETQVVTASVLQVNGFAAIIRPTPKPSDFGSSKEYIHGQAVLQQCQRRWPIQLPEDFHDHGIDQVLKQSQFLRRSEDSDTPLVCLRREQQTLILYNNQGLQLALENLNDDVSLQCLFERLFENAQQYARAQNILSLRSGADEEAFDVNVDIELGIEKNGMKIVLARRSDTLPAGMIEKAPLSFDENDRVYIIFRNMSTSQVFINAISVDAAGKTALISKPWEMGICLTSGRSHTLAVKTFPLRGIPIRWPKSIPRDGYIEERLIFIIASEEVDLRDLDASLKGYVRRGADDAAARDSGIVYFDVEHVRYHLRPCPST